MAKFLDDLLIDARKRQEDDKFACKVGPVTSSFSNSVSRATEEKEKPWWESLMGVLLCYAKALHRGHKNLFQALPRMLTLWFEFGSIYTQDESSSDQHMKEVHGRVNLIAHPFQICLFVLFKRLIQLIAGVKPHPWVREGSTNIPVAYCAVSVDLPHLSPKY